MNKYTFIGNGRNKNFYFTFPFFSKADIVVKINGTATTGYGIFCIQGNANNDFPFTGGHVRFAVAPKPAQIITIERELQYNRLIDYQPTETLNPTTVNQDMNYFFELLKDIKGNLNDFADTYSEFTDQVSAQELKDRIDAVMNEIDNLGDISTINTNITTLGTSVSNLNTALTNLTNSVNGLTTTVGGHTTNIGTLDRRTTGMLDYVIETQAPTSSNNYTWYRKYKSGWVEMGGTIPVKTTTISLPVTLSDTNYCVAIIYKLAPNNNNNATYTSICTHTQTTNQFTIARAENTVKGWYISYMAAASE